MLDAFFILVVIPFILGFVTYGIDKILKPKQSMKKL
jgi:hypothetical protein